MERMMPTLVAPTHDLIRLREPTVIPGDVPLPTWVTTTLRRIPWVVIRRGFVRNGMMPAGVRGSIRSQRIACFVPLADIIESLSPEDLTDSHHPLDQTRIDAAPALAAMARVKPLLSGLGFSWGPGGSVGFEIATGQATATMTSDLDLVLRLNYRIDQTQASQLLADLRQSAAPARVDVMVETPDGGVALADLATSSERVIVRTPAGPRLSTNPWMMQIEDLSEVAS
jgi:phosphoribosyl-dephospho-CoA transferase